MIRSLRKMAGCMSVLRSRQAKAAVLRQLPPLDVRVGTRAGAETPAAAAPSDAAKGVDRGAEVCETQVSMSCGGRDERKELARKDTRAVAVAFCKEAQHLQKLAEDKANERRLQQDIEARPGCHAARCELSFAGSAAPGGASPC